MNAVGEQCAGKSLVAFDEGALCNGRVLLYYLFNTAGVISFVNYLIRIKNGKL